jgi:addiction module HigA family antidote
VEIVDYHWPAERDEMSKSEALQAPVHPGEILRQDFMKPLNLTVNRLALELHVPATRIGQIVHERRKVTTETALRLARYFHTNAEFWLNLQNFYDLEVSRRSGKASEIESQVPLHPLLSPDGPNQLLLSIEIPCRIYMGLSDDEYENGGTGPRRSSLLTRSSKVERLGRQVTERKNLPPPSGRFQNFS